MTQIYRDLSELLQKSIPAEAYFSQLPEQIQMKAMSQASAIRTQGDLRAFARRCAREVE